MKTALSYVWFSRIVNVFIIVSFIITPIYPVFAEEIKVDSSSIQIEENELLDRENPSEDVTNPTEDIPIEPVEGPKEEPLESPEEEPNNEEDLTLLATDGIKQKIEPRRISLGEVDEHSGAFSYSYPFPLPPYRGMNPELSLNYNSQNEVKNSIAGYGFELSVPYIKRLNRNGINYENNDKNFYSSISNELKLIKESDFYDKFGSKKDDGSYLEYKRMKNSDYWSVSTKDGTIYNFGFDDSSKLVDPNNSDNVYAWYITSIVDSNRNTVTYNYEHYNNQIYLSSISYGPYEILLSYDDIESNIISQYYSPDFNIKTTKQLSSVVIKFHNNIEKTLNLIYTIPEFGRVSLLDKIIDNTIPSNPLVTDFGYDEGNFNFERDPDWNMPYNESTEAGLTTTSTNNSIFIDINNDGLIDFVHTTTGTFTEDGDEVCNDYTSTVFINNGNDFIRDPNWKMPCYLSGSNYYKVPLSSNTIFVDINNDGLPDIISMPGGNFVGGGNGLYNDTFRTLYKNNGSGFVKESNFRMPYYANGSYITSPTIGVNTIFNDVNNDGLLDFITTSSSNSAFASDGDSPYNDKYNTVYINNPINNVGYGLVRDTNWDMPYYSSGSTNYVLRLYGQSVFTDVNNDGLSDFIYTKSSAISGGNTLYNDKEHTVFINDGDDFVRDPYWDMPYYMNGSIITALPLSDTKSVFTDINNDGLIDFIYTQYGIITAGNSPYNDPRHTVFINDGDDFVRDPYWDMPYSDTSGYNYGFDLAPHTIFTDINNDGLTDFVYANTGNLLNGNQEPYNDSTHTVFINDGNDFIRDENWNMPNYINGTNAVSLALGYNSLYADINNDGLTDFVTTDPVQTSFLPDGDSSYNDRTKTVFLNTGPQDILLSSITTINGGVVGINYGREEIDNIFPYNSRLPITIPVVRSVSYNDLITPLSVTSYEYEKSLYDYNPDECVSDCKFYKRYTGFGITTKTEPSGNITKTYYHQNDGNDLFLGEVGDDKEKINRPFRIENYDGSGFLYRVTMNIWDKISLDKEVDYPFIYIKKQIIINYNPDGTHFDFAYEYKYDNFANLIQKINYGEVLTVSFIEFNDIDTDKVIEDIIYTNPIDNLVTSFPVTIRRANFEQNKVSEQNIYYDNLTYQNVSNGNPTKIENWIKADTSGINYYSTVNKSYNNYGLVISEIDQRGKTTSYVYDSDNLYPTIATNPLNQNTYYTYDYTSGEVVEVIDENNLKTQAVFDPLDRLIEVRSPSDVSPYTPVTKAIYTYTDTPGAISIQTRKYLSPTVFIESYNYNDGFGRIIQERTQSEITGTMNVKDTGYNSQGLVEKQSLPYTSLGIARTDPTENSSLYVFTSYDAQNRITHIADSTGVTTYTYYGLITTTTDKNGKIKKYYKDAHGNLTQVDEKNGTKIYTTKYGWNMNGNLTSITDALNNIRKFTYDGLGRRTKAEDLHAQTDTTFGFWTYIYDNASNLITTISPRNIIVNYTYNDINQLISEDAITVSGVDVTYNYGGCNLGINKVCSVVTNSGVNTSYFYDSSGNITQEIKTINGATYNTYYSYDYLGNLLKITYPDQAEVKYTYNIAGAINKVESRESGGTFSNIIDNISYNPLGQVSSINYSNGVTTTNYYDSEHLNRLTRKLTENSSGTKLQDLNYIYDAVGNILHFTDSSNTTTAKSLHYSYDDLYRLTGVNGSYYQFFVYNEIGNLTQGPSGYYTYAGGLSNYYNPHAATKVGSKNQTYDNEGNLLTSSNFTNTWSYNNRLTKNVKGSGSSAITTTYLYDYRGERSYQKVSYVTNGSRTTYYPNDYYNNYSDSTNYLAQKKTKQIYAGGELVATIETTLELDEDDNVITVYNTYFNHNDMLGSVNAISNISGNLVSAQDYYPYGGSRVSSGSYNSQRKYIGEIYDSISELNYLNARYYDGNKGRFVSQDPVFWEIGQSENGKMALLNPQSQNSYSYANNNPITYSDPDGKFVPALIVAAGMLAMYAPQITSFAQSLMTPIGQFGVSQAIDDTNRGSYGWAVFGFATAGESSELKILKEAKMATLEKLPGCTLVCRGVEKGKEMEAFVSGVTKDADGTLSNVSVFVDIENKGKEYLLDRIPGRFGRNGIFSTLDELKKNSIKFDPSGIKKPDHFDISNFTEQEGLNLFKLLNNFLDN